jgi:uncharacterized iron-regulated membrane protein
MEILFVLVGLFVIVYGSVMWWYRTRGLGPDDEVELSLDTRQDRNTYEGLKVLQIAFGVLILFYGLII